MVNLRTFDLNLLRVFEAMIQDRSVSKAADGLGLSQPAVSNALNRMRRQFDDPLFVRTQLGMEPTPKAQQLADTLLQGLTTIRAGLSSDVNFNPALSRRRFTLLMTDVGEIVFLPAVLARLRHVAPNIELKVMEFGIERYEELLENGMADLAIGLIKLADSLSSEMVHTSPYAVVMHPGNPHLKRDAVGRVHITFEDYLEAPHVLLAPRGASGDPVTQALGRHASSRRVALSIPHTTVLPMIIGQTDLIATVPRACADHLVAGGGLCAVDAPLEIEQIRVRQWWHKRNTSDPGHRWLRQIFSEWGSDGTRRL